MPALVVVDGQHLESVVPARPDRLPSALFRSTVPNAARSLPRCLPRAPGTGTMGAPSFADSSAGVLEKCVRDLARDPGASRVRVVSTTVFRSGLLEPILGRRFSFVTTAAVPVRDHLTAHLEREHGGKSSASPALRYAGESLQPKYPSTRKARVGRGAQRDTPTGTGSGGEI